MNLQIVEDNTQMRLMIKSVVADLDHRTSECCYGVDALPAYTKFWRGIT